MTSGFCNSMVRSRKGRHISVSASVGVRLPGGRQKIALVMNTELSRSSAIAATARWRPACGRAIARTCRQTVCPGCPRRVPAPRPPASRGLAGCHRHSTAVSRSSSAGRHRNSTAPLRSRQGSAARPHRQAAATARRQVRSAPWPLAGSWPRPVPAWACAALVRQTQCPVDRLFADDLVSPHFGQPAQRLAAACCGVMSFCSCCMSELAACAATLHHYNRPPVRIEAWTE